MGKNRRKESMSAEDKFELICCSPYKDKEFGWFVRLVYKCVYNGEVEFIEIPRCELPFMISNANVSHDINDLPRLQLSTFGDNVKLYPDSDGNCLYVHKVQEKKVHVRKSELERMMGHKIEIVER